MIQPTRLRTLCDKPIDPKAKYVLYWMQQAARVRYNHALAAAIARAKELRLPVVVCFGLMDDYPEANERHYAFLLEGLRDMSLDLADIGIRFVVRHGQPFEAALHYGRDAAVIYCDRGYLRHQKRWRDAVADGASVRVIEVESDVVVPVDVVSDKHESAARTIRPKLHRKWDEYRVPLRMPKVDHPSMRMRISGDIDVANPEAAIKKLKIDRGVKKSQFFEGGSRAGEKLLTKFLAGTLDGYNEGRNEPADGRTSQMSKYLHFGHVSPLELALRVAGAKSRDKADRDGYLEELIIRRELSMNFCNFAADYDKFSCVPNWAKKTLAVHAGDKRPVTYTRDELEKGRTSDRYWNAAQLQMVVTGFMHNYMRMYWGKKILEWTDYPEEAFDRTMYLNNRYELDGRDANSYANVAWVFGLHDRPWGGRPIFGNVRYMNAAGLERKYDIDRYVSNIDALTREYLDRGIEGESA